MVCGVCSRGVARRVGDPECAGVDGSRRADRAARTTGRWL